MWGPQKFGGSYLISEMHADRSFPTFVSIDRKSVEYS